MPKKTKQSTKSKSPLKTRTQLKTENHNIRQMLETILEQTHIQIAYLDPDFNFILVNRAYAEADEREPSFYPGKNHFDLFPYAENQQIFRQVVKSGKSYFAYAKPFEYAEHPERGVTYWDWSLVPYKDEKGTVIGLVLSASNVTSRILAEQELRSSEEKFATIFRMSSAGIAITRAIDNTFIDVNEMFSKLSGYSRSEVIGKTWHELGLVRSPEILDKMINIFTEKSEVSNFELDYIGKDRKTITALTSLTPVIVNNEPCVMTIVYDITKRKHIEEKLNRYRDSLEVLVKERTEELSQKIAEYKKAEEKVRKAELRYRTVADFTYDWEYWEAPDGTLNYVSPSVERITGFKAEEFVEDPKLLQRIILPEDKDNWNEHYREMLEKKGQQQFQFRIKSRDGKVRWIEHACRAAKDDKNRFLGFRASNRDITQRKQAQTEVQQQRQELSHVGRVATIGELTGALAHELNQPLSAILSNAQAGQRFLMAESPDLDELKDILSAIVTENKRASEVIKGIRALLKKEKMAMKPISINEVIQEVVSLTKSDAVIRNIEVKLDLAPQLPYAFGDRIQLQQIILNLMVNGFEAMTHQKFQPREMFIRTKLHNKKMIRVDIQDAGTGIKEEKIEKIFEPFYTTKSAGMGMGLSINKSIIEAHGGKIWVRNNPDSGATFSFTLPLNQEDLK